jgi:4,5-dihydroxyphthalate decarboxylase
MPDAAVLSTVLADYPQTQLLKSGELSHPEVRFEFHTVQPVHKAFAPMVRHEAYDLSELAIVTALQAVAFDRPIIVLPVVVASRFQRACIVSAAARGPLDPKRLADKRIGVRAFTQTTGMWVRAHLEEDYGLPVGRMHWVTQDPAHVEQYSDPPNVEHVGRGESLPDMLLQGSLDAIIMGNDLPKGNEFIPVNPDSVASDRAWWEKHGFMPINHMVAVSRTAAERAPEAIRAAYGLLAEAYARTRVPAGEPSRTMLGFEELSGPIEFTIGHCRRQGLLPRDLSVDQVLGPAIELLGAEAVRQAETI